MTWLPGVVQRLEVAVAAQYLIRQQVYPARRWHVTWLPGVVQRMEVPVAAQYLIR